MYFLLPGFVALTRSDCKTFHKLKVDGALVLMLTQQLSFVIVFLFLFAIEPI